MIRMQEKIGISSHIVVMHLGGQRRQEITTEFLRIKRGLDLYWQTYVQDKPMLAILMPFTSASAKDGFLQRIEAWLQHRFQGNFDALGIQLRIINFEFEDPLTALCQCVNGDMTP